MAKTRYPACIVHQQTDQGVYTSDIPFDLGGKWVRRCTLGRRAWYEVLGTRGVRRQENGKLFLDVWPFVAFHALVAKKVANALDIEVDNVVVL